MAITKGLMYSRMSSAAGTGTGLYRRMRLGASRQNFFGPKVLCTVGGTVRTYNFDRETYTVTQRKRGQPRTLSIEFFGFTPTVGLEVILGAGALTNRLFRGKITSVEQVRLRQNQGRTIYACTCLDWSYDIDGVRNVTAKFTSTTATSIVTTLFASYAPAGFTANHIQADLASLDEIQFTMQSFNEALQQVCDRIGGYFYWDTEKDLHLFTSDTTGMAGEPLSSTNKHIHNLHYKTDIEDLRNRIYVEGKGTTVLAACAAAETILPLSDASAFNVAGGTAKLEAQLAVYTAVVAGGRGSVTLGLTVGPTSPSAVVAAGQSGNVTGVVSYKVVHRLPTGDSEPSAASSNATVAAISAPGSAPTSTPSTTTDGGLAPGGRKYTTTFVTATGETLAGTRTATSTISAVTAPVGGSTAGSTGGSVPVSSTYYTAVSYITAAGETTPSFIGTVATSGVQNRIAWSSIPTSADGRVTGRRLYRSPAINGSLANMKLVTTINDNVTATFNDDLADASLGAIAPTTNTTGGRYALTSIPTSADSRVTARRIYRTEAGGTVYKLLTTISDNVTTTFTDTTNDSSLGNTEPLTDTVGGGVITVTVPVGGTTVTARRIYRTEAGGTVYRLVGTIQDNVTTTYTDSKADASLGDVAPDASTVRTEAGATSLYVADPAVFGTRSFSPGFTDQGWVIVDSQVLRYNGGLDFLGLAPGSIAIPASGVGALTAPVAAGSAVIVLPQLTGVTVGGSTGLATALAEGDSINILVTVNDTTSQGTYGVRGLFVQDRRLGADGADDRGSAELALRKDPRVSGGFDSSDPKIHAGAPLTFSNWGLTGTVVVEQITIKSPPDRPQPIASVQIASRSIEDFYATLREIKDRLNR